MIPQDVRERLERAEKALLTIGPVGNTIIGLGQDIEDPIRRLDMYYSRGLEIARVAKKYEEYPVGPEEFVCSENYLNQPNSLWPEVMKHYVALNSGEYDVAVLTGAIGTAKTTIALFTQAYQLYLLSIMRSPQRVFDLIDTDEIVVIFQSLTATLARTVDYSRFEHLIKRAPYFKNNFPPDKDLKSELHFPKRIIVKPVAGTDTAAIGQNVFGGLIDECLVGDTLVSTPSGLRRLDMIQVGDTVLGISGPDKVVAAHCTGLKPTFSVEFDNGVVLRGSEDHPIATCRGWVTIGALVIGDVVYAEKIEGGNQGTEACTYAGLGVINQFKAGYSSEEISKQSIAELGCGYAYPRSFGEGTVVTHRQETQCRDQTETVRSTHGVFVEDEFCFERAVGFRQVRGQQAVSAFEAGGFGGGASEQRPARGKFFIRDRASALCEGWFDQDDCGGFFSYMHGWDVIAGNKEQFHVAISEGEGFRNAEFCFDERVAVRSLGRVRVRAKTPTGIAQVYNLETAQNHSFFANGILTHNCNFMAVTENSKQARGSDGGKYDQAQKLWNAIERRRESRFMQPGGRYPGIMCLISSKQYPGEFTERIAKQAQKELLNTGITHTYVYDKRRWEVRPDQFKGSKWFEVFVGDDSRKPRVLADGETVPEADAPLILRVPEEYKKTFENNLLDALRDVGGTATQALHPFIPNVEKIAAVFKNSAPSILTREWCDFVQTKIAIDPNMIRSPKEPRFVHIDLALSNDSAGIACGYIERFVPVSRGDTIEILPHICFDYVLEVKPPPNDEIPFGKIRELVYKQTELGMNVRWITLDSYQSRDSVQIFRQKKYISGLQSVDTDLRPYMFLKGGILDGRVQAPAQDKAKVELAQLEWVAKKKKVDHPPLGSKDLSDCMAGVVFGLTMRLELWARHKVRNVIPQSVLAASANTDEEEGGGNANALAEI